MKVYILSLFTLLVLNSTASDFILKSEAIADLELFHAKLKTFHPNLYLYSTKEDIDFYFQHVILSLKDSIGKGEFYELVAGSSQFIKDGHTTFLPGKAALQNLFTTSLLLPFDTYWNGDSLIITRNLSSESKIYPGAIITSINGIDVNEIILRVRNTLPRDGDNLQYPGWIINHYLYSYMNFVIGDIHTIEIQQGSNTFSVTGLLNTLIGEKIKLQTDTLVSEKLLSFELNKEISTGTITIATWNNYQLKNEGIKFRKEIDKYFEQIEAAGPNHLIIDIRDNQGGTLKNGKHLLSHLLEKKYKIVERYARVKRPATDDSEIKLRRSYIDYGRKYKPSKQAYNGSVYVLINGGSFSNSGMFSACLSRQERATFIGETMGGDQNILSSDYKQIILPNSKIEIQIPSLRYTMPSALNNNSGGLVPHYVVSPSYNSVVNHLDIQKTFVKELIRKQM